MWAQKVAVPQYRKTLQTSNVVVQRNMVSLSGPNIEPVSVAQSSTFKYQGVRYVAERAIDGDMNTVSHTYCAWNTDLWYKMELDAVHCVTGIALIQSHYGLAYAFRMQDLKVILMDSTTGTESVCGTLRVRQVWTAEGQTYWIPCDVCGDQVKLLLRHDKGEYSYPACIHIRELKAVKGGL